MDNTSWRQSQRLYDETIVDRMNDTQLWNDITQVNDPWSQWSSPRTAQDQFPTRQFSIMPLHDSDNGQLDQRQAAWQQAYVPSESWRAPIYYDPARDATLRDCAVGPSLNAVIPAYEDVAHWQGILGPQSSSMPIQMVTTPSIIRHGQVPYNLDGRRSSQTASTSDSECSVNLSTFYTKGPWTVEDDQELLSKYVEAKATLSGKVPWTKIGKSLSRPRTGLQTCARYTEVLDVSGGRVRGRWSEQEDAILMQQWKLCGGRWSVICRDIPGRTQRQCASRFGVLYKRLSLEERQEMQKLHEGLEEQAQAIRQILLQ